MEYLGKLKYDITNIYILILIIIYNYNYNYNYI